MNRKIMAVLLAGLLLIITACSPKHPQDPVVAVAYGNSITARQVQTVIELYCSQYGITLEQLKEDTSAWERMRADVVRQLTVQSIAAHKAEEQGYLFDSQEEARFYQGYNQMLEQMDAANRSVALAQSGSSSQELEQKLPELREVFFAAQGYTAQSFERQQKENYIAQRVKELALGQITVTEAEIQDYYERNTKQQQEAAASGAQGSNTGLTLYYPKGYRYIKPLLLGFAPDVIVQAAQLYAGDDPALDQVLEAEKARLQPVIDEIQEKLAQGVGIDALIEQYGQEQAMKNEPAKTTGYFIPQGAPELVESYRAAADSLQAVGEIAQCVTYRGYYLLYAQEVVAEGPAPYEEVYGEIKQTLLSGKQMLAWDEMTSAWLQAGEATGEVQIDLSKFS